jgi:hypothetical protein
MPSKSIGEPSTTLLESFAMDAPREPSSTLPKPSPSPVLAHTLLRADLPGGLAAALALQFVGIFAAVMRSSSLDYDPAHNDAFREAVIRWDLISIAITFCTLALAISGGFELVRRTRGRARFGAWIALAPMLVLFAARAVSEYLYRTRGYSPTALLDFNTPSVESEPVSPSLWMWISPVHDGCWLISSVGFALCGRHRATVSWLAAPLLLAAAFAFAHQSFAPSLYAGHSGMFRYLAAHFVYFLLALIALQLGDHLADEGGWHRTCRALEHMGRFLSVQMWLGFVALMLPVFLFARGGTAAAETLLDVASYGLPLLLAALHLPIVWGAMSAASLAVRGTPGVRLYAAGTLLLAVSVISAIQALHGHRALPGVAPEAEALPLLLPLLYWFAFLCLALGLRRLAELTLDFDLQVRTNELFVTVAIAQSVASGLQAAIKAGGLPSLLGLICSLFAIITSIVALSRLGGMCRELVAVLRDRGDVPSAIALPRAADR